MAGWAKVPIAWATDGRLSDMMRVYLAICDQTRSKSTAVFRPQMVQVCAKLSADRVAQGVRALTDCGAIVLENGVVTVTMTKALISRTRVEKEHTVASTSRTVRTVVPTPRKELTVGGKHRARAVRATPLKNRDLSDTFAERNRLAKVRAKLLDEAKAFFEGRNWDVPHKRQRIAAKLRRICDDEIAPDELRNEIREYLRTRTQKAREQTNNEDKGKGGWH